MEKAFFSRPIIGFFSFPLSNLLSNDQLSSINWNLKVNHFINNCNWDQDLLFFVVDTDIVNKICSIALLLAPQHDSICWGRNANGNFLVKSATWIPNGANNGYHYVDLLSKLSIPHKVKLFSS